jgi:Helicase conserved C-terminal domain
VPASSSSTLSLAGRLRDLGDEALVALLTAREIRDSRIRDFFDLADALLDPAGIQKALATLDRTTLAALAALGDATDGLTTARLTDALAALHPTAEVAAEDLELARDLALVDRTDDRWTTYEPVASQLASWPTIGLPSLAELLSDPAPASLSPVSASDVRFIDHAASEHAFAATNAVAALLGELQREPARELARGGIALPETKRLATAMGLELEDVAPLVEIAARADLASLDGGNWMTTDKTEEWMLRSNAERWARLAGAWFDRLSDDVRGLLAARAGAVWGERLAEYVRWLYPAGGTWMRDRTLALSRDADILGITANATPSTAGAALLEHDEAAAAAVMTTMFPAEIDRVYLQHDLSIVAPGPLLPRLDARLRAMADVETRTLATTYRMSEGTINRALTTGETADSIREFLTSIALTGIPQPLEYLIVGAAARFGSLRVGAIVDPQTAPNQQGARSYIAAEDASMMSAIMVDHGLISLSLIRIGPYRAVSRFETDVVFWSLSEARYPVAAEDANGTIILVDRMRAARASAPVADSPAKTIVHRLRMIAESTPVENSQAWLERQLDTAIKGKIGLTVTVAMPDGSSIDLQLEPASLAGGRLRARDRRSDLERTLPLSSITAVGPPER